MSAYCSCHDSTVDSLVWTMLEEERFIIVCPPDRDVRMRTHTHGGLARGGARSIQVRAFSTGIPLDSRDSSYSSLKKQSWKLSRTWQELETEEANPCESAPPLV